MWKMDTNGSDRGWIRKPVNPCYLDGAGRRTWRVFCDEKIGEDVSPLYHARCH